MRSTASQCIDRMPNDIYIHRRFGVCASFLDVPLTGKSASFRSCVRAGEAKLRVCVREIMLLYAGLPILESFSSSSPSSPSPSSSLMGHCVLHGFYRFS